MTFDVLMIVSLYAALGLACELYLYHVPDRRIPWFSACVVLGWPGVVIGKAIGVEFDQ
jgi:hypothetical protein